MTRSVLVAGLLSCAAVGSAGAQSLDSIAPRIVAVWNRNDAAALTVFAAKQGITLQLAGERVGPLAARQAAAALRNMFAKVETVQTLPGMAKEVDGQPRRAFLELTWVTRPPGTSETSRSTVFIALVLEENAWRITEIRHMQ